MEWRRPHGIRAVGCGLGSGRQYDVATDGRFLINTVLDDSTASITLLLKWHSEAKKWVGAENRSSLVA